MKLVCYRAQGRRQLGVVLAGGIAPAGDPEAFFADVDAGLARLRGLRPEGLIPEAEVQLLPPVPAAPKIVGVGLNYKRHAERLKMATTDVPTFFAKYPNALRGQGGVIPRPAGAERLDAEAELAIVIGHRARAVSRASAMSHVLGYTCGNDVSARDLQFRTSQWFSGKVCDGFCPLGPYLLTSDEAGNPDDLSIRGFRNGELVQDSRTSDMIFTCAEIIAHASAILTLEPGDVILTGTPEGTVADRGSLDWWRDGEEMAVEVQGLGRLVSRLAR